MHCLEWPRSATGSQPEGSAAGGIETSDWFQQYVVKSVLIWLNMALRRCSFCCQWGQTSSSAIITEMLEGCTRLLESSCTQVVAHFCIQPGERVLCPSEPWKCSNRQHCLCRKYKKVKTTYAQDKLSKRLISWQYIWMVHGPRDGKSTRIQGGFNNNVRHSVKRFLQMCG